MVGFGLNLLNAPPGTWHDDNISEGIYGLYKAGEIQKKIFNVHERNVDRSIVVCTCKPARLKKINTKKKGEEICKIQKVTFFQLLLLLI